MSGFEEFKAEMIKRNPKLKRTSDAYLRQMYEQQVGKEKVAQINAEEEKAISSVLLTTETYPPFPVGERIDVVTAECAFGMNIFRDIFAGMTDVFGGRSKATQKVLRDARKTVLKELRREAYRVGANGVIGVSLTYNEFSGGGKSMLFVVACGTAVRFEESEGQK